MPTAVCDQEPPERTAVRPTNPNRPLRPGQSTPGHHSAAPTPPSRLRLDPPVHPPSPPDDSRTPHAEYPPIRASAENPRSSPDPQDASPFPPPSHGAPPRHLSRPNPRSRLEVPTPHDFVMKRCRHTNNTRS